MSGVALATLAVALVIIAIVIGNGVLGGGKMYWVATGIVLSAAICLILSATLFWKRP